MCNIPRRKSIVAKARAWGDGKIQAIRHHGRQVKNKLKKRVELSFSLIGRLFLQCVLTGLIIAFSPFLLLFALTHDWLMKKFINYAYIYNVSWEDPRMDQEVFKLRPDDHVITIASAGDNVLDYIIEGARVTAVDFNACQIALTEIKAVAIMELSFDQFFAIFAKNDIALLKEVYPTKLKPKMTPESVEYWDQFIHKITSFMYSGTSGFLAFLAFRVVFPLLWLGWIRKAIQDGISRQEFLKLAKSHEKQITILAWLLDTLFPCFALFAGVPRRQMNLGAGRENFSVIVEHVLFKTDIVHDNYFYAGYILGEYTTENCPRYLKQENFDRMKKHLKMGKLHLFHGSIEQAIMENKKNNDELFTVASLLDHMDWMDKAMVTSELSLLWERIDKTRGRFYWRSFSENVHIPPLVWLNPTKVDDIYINTMNDRVGMYFSTWIASAQDTQFAITARCKSWSNRDYEAGVAEKLVTGAKIITAPVWKKVMHQQVQEGSSKHEKDMEAFYRYQKDGYDSFRENFLHARKDLMESVPLKKDSKNIWIDVGGGTARNLEFIPVSVIKECFSAIYIVDVSASLLQIAEKRVKEMGLEKIVHLIRDDFTAPAIFKRISNMEGRVDLVTFSYSLSMIPDKQSAIKHALRFLKTSGDGVIGIADFFLRGNDEDALPILVGSFRKAEALFQKKWFEQDRVNLLSPAIMEKLEKSTSPVWDERFRGGVPFLPLLRPYHGVYVATTLDSKLQ